MYNKFEIKEILQDGRIVYNAPEERWLLKSTPEFEVICLACGNTIRFTQSDGYYKAPDFHTYCKSKGKSEVVLKEIKLKSLGRILENFKRG